MKCKIAVIDSGYSYTEKCSLNNIESGYTFLYKDNKIICEQYAFDKDGHGTNVIETILKYNPEVQIIPIKITVTGGITNKSLLYHALKKCLKLGVNLINISISCTKSIFDVNIEEILSELYSKNIIVVTSLLNKKNCGYPGESIYTIGVGEVNLGKHVQKCLKMSSKLYLFNSNPIFVRGCNGYNFFKGTSKSTALCTAILAQQYNKGMVFNLKSAEVFIDSLCISPSSFREILNDYIHELNVEKKSFLSSDKMKLLVKDTIYELTNKEIKDNDFENTKTFSKDTGLNFLNFYDLLNKICTHLKTTIDMHDIYIEDVYCISALINFLQRRMLK